MTDTVSSPASSGLVDRVKNILLSPRPTWDVIDTEPSSIRSIYMGYVIPLAAIGPIAGAIGMSLIGTNAIFVSFKMPWVWSIGQAIVSYLLSLGLVYVQALVINALAPNFGGQQNMTQAFKVSAYAATAAWVGGIFGLLPMLGIVVLAAAVYSLYLFYVGLPKLMKVAPDKALPYAAVVIIISIVLALVVGGIAGAVGGLGRLGSHLAGVPTGSVATVAVPGTGVSANLDKMQAAADQMSAAAAAMQSGKSNVKVADPVALLALMPANFMGAAPSETSSNSDAAGGMATSHAEATYTVNGGTVRLKISDMGSLGGFGAMAQAFDVNHTENTATGYEKVVSNNGVMTSEKYDNTTHSGEYTTMAGTRIAIEAEGTNVDMATMKALVAGIDAGKAKALAQ